MRDLLIIRWLLAAMLAFTLPVQCAWAVESAFVYSRTNVVIMHAGMESKPIPLPWQSEKEAEGSAGVIFDVEIRDAMTLYNQSGWYNLSGPSEKSGVMLVFKDEGIAPITASAQYAPLDILIIDREGKINKIVPNLMLSQLDQDIVPDAPVKAFLFLKGGVCQKLGINPGDYVLYKLFKRPPAVLSAPSQPSAEPQKAPALMPQIAPEKPTEKPAEKTQININKTEPQTAPADAAGKPASSYPVSDAPVTESMPPADGGDMPVSLSDPRARRKVNSAPMMIPVQ